MLDRLILAILALIIAINATPAKKWKLEFDVPGVVEDIAKITGLGDKLVSKTKHMPNNVKVEIETPDVKQILRSVRNYMVQPNNNNENNEPKTFPTNDFVDTVEKSGKELKNMLLNMGKGLSKYVSVNTENNQENDYFQRGDYMTQENRGNIKNNRYKKFYYQNGGGKNSYPVKTERHKNGGNSHQFWGSRRHLYNTGQHISGIHIRHPHKIWLLRRLADNTFPGEDTTNQLQSPGTFKTALWEYPPYYYQNRVRVLLKLKDLKLKEEKKQNRWKKL